MQDLTAAAIEATGIVGVELGLAVAERADRPWRTIRKEIAMPSRAVAECVGAHFAAGGRVLAVMLHHALIRAFEIAAVLPSWPRRAEDLEVTIETGAGAVVVATVRRLDRRAAATEGAT